MLNNNMRFKLPSFNIIGGSTKLFRVSLNDLFGSSSVLFCSGISSDNLSIVDMNGESIAPDQNCIYVINDGDSEFQYYMWDGELYTSPSFILSVSDFAGFSTNLILEKKVYAQGTDVCIILNFNNTINTSGKFVYQVAACTNSSENFNYIAEQGFLIISKNIDLEDNILNGTDDSSYEDDGLLFTYEEKQAYAVGAAPFESNWISLSPDGAPVVPADNIIYIISDGDYAGKYVWDASTVTYIEYED